MDYGRVSKKYAEAKGREVRDNLNLRLSLHPRMGTKYK